MRLISLELDGFKSFADKTVINFQDGVTGIIGPNGSGKSNVIEAIRWVMGEQSAKTLRGEKMADVIFNGAKDRAPLNRAQVKLTLDNSDHFLATPYTEVTVCRKLFRSGVSEYLINGQAVRLKDITNLFLGSGIGKESFAVISQGRVAAIFNGKPEDRRQLIEAVAGVGKYRADKAAAEKRLAETNDNLNRVNDIAYELQQRLGPLEEQRALAQDYLAQKDRLDLLDQTATVRRVLAAKQELAAVKQQRARAEKLAADYEQRVHAANATTGKLQTARRAQVKQKDAAQATILNLTQQLAHLNNDQSLAKVKRDQAEAELARQQAALEALGADLTAARAAKEAAAQAVADHQAAVAKAKESLAADPSASAAQRQAELEATLAKLRDQQVDQVQQLTTLHNQATFLKQDHQRGESQAKAASADQSARAAKREELQAQLTEKKGQQEAAAARLADLKKQVTATQGDLTATQAAYEEAQKAWYQALGNLQSQQARVKNYQAMAADYTGYYYGVQNVLREREQFSGLFGPVSELITVPKEYTPAFETVLGGQLQQLVVADQETGKTIIRYLTRTRGGRVTLLPLNALRQSRVPASWNQLRQAPGVIGRAPELIQYAPQFQPVIDYLLATTIVVDTLDHATALSRQTHHQFRLVTVAGEVINASGAMSGGKNRQQRVGLLTQREHQQEFEAAVTQAEGASKAAEQRVGQLQAKRQRLQQTGAALTDQVQAAQEEVARLASEAGDLTNQVTELDRQLAALKLAAANQSDQHQHYQEAVDQNQAATAKLSAAAAATKAALAEKQAELTDLSAKRTAQAEQRHQLEQALAVEQERLHQAQADCDHQESVLEQAGARQQAIEKAIEELKHQLAAPQQASGEKTAALEEELKKAKQEVATLDDNLAAGEAALTSAQEEAERLQGLMRAAYDDLTRINERRLNQENLVDQGLNHLSSDYQLTLEAAQERAVDLADEELQRQLKLLHRGIAELGTVNLASIEEYDQVKERADFLAAQQADLQEAERQLRETMAQMDEEVKRRFSTTFDQLSTAFATTFNQIFAGGEAKLILTDPHDLLTTGVDIYAQPPGKKRQQLTLLSGGEKALTALALLFAILKVHPVPFAILDEPEAALDDVNVDRFATYLDRFGNQGPQFIVITHRKGTMVNADVLYGVTMQDSGVSKVITVNVDETLKAAQKK